MQAPNTTFSIWTTICTHATHRFKPQKSPCLTKPPTQHTSKPPNKAFPACAGFARTSSHRSSSPSQTPPLSKPASLNFRALGSSALPPLARSSNSSAFPSPLQSTPAADSKHDSQRSSMDGITHQMAANSGEKDAEVKEAFSQGLFGPRQHSLISSDDDDVVEADKEDSESTASITCCGRLHNCLAFADFARAVPGVYSVRCGLCAHASHHCWAAVCPCQPEDRAIVVGSHTLAHRETPHGHDF